MRRADRLFKLVQLLRRTRLLTAQRLARELEVSERTVYRDVRDLALSGVPIRGEAGVGYALAQGFDLPPLMFSPEEIEALVLGARVVHSHADPELARAADSALAKIEIVLPEPLRAKVSHTNLYAPTWNAPPGLPALTRLRSAIRESRRVRFRYHDEHGQETVRQVRPLALAFWGRVWSMAAWCELRDGFRSFRVDRVSDLEATASFEPEPGRTLDDFIRYVTAAGATNRARE
jgi:predicted DNA-binding transcriptional regulator YafY